MSLPGKEFRLWNPTMTTDDIARRLGVKHGGDFPVGWFSAAGELVAIRDGQYRLKVLDIRPDLQVKACQFADEVEDEGEEE